MASPREELDARMSELEPLAAAMVLAAKRLDPKAVKTLGKEFEALAERLVKAEERVRKEAVV